MNIPRLVLDKTSRKLHNVPNHPLQILKRTIYDYFQSLDREFAVFDDLPQIVSVEDNFDSLLIPESHPARKPTDTYYVDDTHVLRTHTTAHQNQLLASGCTSFLVTGDVYRKDSIDKTHYPVFHQMEGVTWVPEGNMPAQEYLKSLLSGLVQRLFPGCTYRFNSDYFPFTVDSLEVEVMFRDQWLEVLGCGVVHPDIRTKHGISQQLVAWGLGLERLCMIMCDIQDIRQFWSQDERFLEQFRHGRLVPFVPYSDVQPIIGDISFWVPATDIVTTDDNVEWTRNNDFCELVRDISDDLVQSVTLFDTFFHPVHKKHSHTYRLVFAPAWQCTNPAELFKAANDTMDRLRTSVATKLGVVLR